MSAMETLSINAVCRWNGTLRHFLLELALAFCIRIEQDQARSYALTFGNGGGSSSDSPWDPSSLAVGPKKLSRIRNGPKLPESTREAVVDLLIRLGSTAQYSKVQWVFFQFYAGPISIAVRLLCLLSCILCGRRGAADTEA